MGLSDQIRQAAEIIRAGGIAAFPTETVYVLGADVYNRKAIARVFEAKKRPKFDPLIVHIADLSQMQPFVQEIPQKAQQLINRFWPGALTLVLPRKAPYHDMMSAGLSGVAVRFPSNMIAQEIIRASGAPIAVASANVFGNVSPTMASHVQDDLGQAVDIVVDGGASEIGMETTIISFIDEYPVMLRPGAVPQKEIEEVIGPICVSETAGNASFFPGMSDHHYTQRTVMLFSDQIEQLPKNLEIGLLSFKPVADAGDYAAVEVLSATGDLNEAARNLFAALRRLDAMDLDMIVAQKVPDTGIGEAINDRLMRAAF